MHPFPAQCRRNQRNNANPNFKFPFIFTVVVFGRITAKAIQCYTLIKKELKTNCKV